MFIGFGMEMKKQKGNESNQLKLKAQLYNV